MIWNAESSPCATHSRCSLCEVACHHKVPTDRLSLWESTNSPSTQTHPHLPHANVCCSGCLSGLCRLVAVAAPPRAPPRCQATRPLPRGASAAEAFCRHCLQQTIRGVSNLSHSPFKAPQRHELVLLQHGPRPSCCHAQVMCSRSVGSCSWHTLGSPAPSLPCRCCLPTQPHAMLHRGQLHHPGAVQPQARLRGACTTLCWRG